MTEAGRVCTGWIWRPRKLGVVPKLWRNPSLSSYEAGRLSHRRAAIRSCGIAMRDLFIFILGGVRTVWGTSRAWIRSRTFYFTREYIVNVAAALSPFCAKRRVAVFGLSAVCSSRHPYTKGITHSGCVVRSFIRVRPFLHFIQKYLYTIQQPHPGQQPEPEPWHMETNI